MKKTGAQLAVYALEQLGMRHTFGIPGTHTTELYDELNNSEQITPILVTHEGGGAFMADAVSRTTDQTGTLAIVPAAGATHAMSGIGEAYLDGIPMLVISGGTRRDSGRHYQLHQIDQQQLVGGVVKQFFLIEQHADIIPTIYEAYRVANAGEPGPVFVEIPVELMLFREEVEEFPRFKPTTTEKKFNAGQIAEAAKLLAEAEHPGIYLGWGAVDAGAWTTALADRLAAPVATTLQGKSAFPASHPLHTGVGFGPTGLPAAQNAFKNCDCLLAVGARFAEIATGSYGLTVPENLIHIDINPEVFDKNYPSRLAIEGDANAILPELQEAVEMQVAERKDRREALAAQIAKDKHAYRQEWLKKPLQDKVSPGYFFDALQAHLPEDAYMVVDDGKHTFLAAELFDVFRPRHFISPTDFNCMGYCVPAAVAAKLTHPEHPVVAIVGDGAFMMTGMELITATVYGLGLVVYVFHDGELGQISQFQQIPLNRKTCTVLGQINLEGVAIATGAHFLTIDQDGEVESRVKEAQREAQRGRPVLVDVRIDYSKRTLLTKGVVKTNLARFPFREKVRFLQRAVKRQILG